jgi:hypothetical protein
MIIICNLHRCDICDDLLIPDANYLRTLDSSIKRNTTVIKKLKTINDEQKDGLMEELKSVNLSKFVSEAVSYICEAKLRSADIQAAVQVIYICNMIFFCYTLRKSSISNWHGCTVIAVDPSSLHPVSHIHAYRFIAVGHAICDLDLCLCQACSCP